MIRTLIRYWPKRWVLRVQLVSAVLNCLLCLFNTLSGMNHNRYWVLFVTMPAATWVVGISLFAFWWVSRKPKLVENPILPNEAAFYRGVDYLPPFPDIDVDYEVWRANFDARAAASRNARNKLSPRDDDPRHYRQGL